MDAVSAFIVPGVLFLLALPFGLWLSRTGKPYSTLLFTAHKLIALGALVAAGLQAYNAWQYSRSDVALGGLLLLTGGCGAALFASGALMSMNKPGQSTLLALHRTAVALVILAGLASVAILPGRLT